MESKINLALLQGEVRMVTAEEDALLMEEIPAKVAGCPVELTYQHDGRPCICRRFQAACYYPRESSLHLLVEREGTLQQRQIDTSQISYRLLLGISSS